MKRTVAYPLLLSVAVAVVIGALIGRDPPPAGDAADAAAVPAAAGATPAAAGGSGDASAAARESPAATAPSAANRGAEDAATPEQVAPDIVRIPVPPEFANQLESGGGLAEFHRKLEAELRDPLWAGRVESFLRDHFNSSLDLNKFRIDAIECRATACEVLAVGYGSDALKDWMTSVSAFIDSFGSDEEFEAFFGGPGSMGCGGSDFSPGVITLSCTFQREEPRQGEEPAAETFSLDAPYPGGVEVEPVPVDAAVAQALESSREMYELHRRLELETRDYGWANYIEPLVAEYMRTVSPEVGIEFIGVTCRATLCEVQMSASDEEVFINWLPAMFEFHQLEWHDLTTAGLDGGDVIEGDSGEPAGLVWFLERRPDG